MPTKVEPISGGGIDTNVNYDEKKAVELFTKYINPSVSDKQQFVREFIDWLSKDHLVDGFNDEVFDKINSDAFDKFLQMSVMETVGFIDYATDSMDSGQIKALIDRRMEDVESDLEDAGVEFADNDAKVQRLNAERDKIKSEIRDDILEQARLIEQDRSTLEITFQDVLDLNDARLYAKFDPLSEKFKERYSASGFEKPEMLEEEELVRVEDIEERRGTLEETREKRETVREWLDTEIKFDGNTEEVKFMWDIGRSYYPGRSEFKIPETGINSYSFKQTIKPTEQNGLTRVGDKMGRYLPALKNRVARKLNSLQRAAKRLNKIEGEVPNNKVLNDFLKYLREEIFGSNLRTLRDILTSDTEDKELIDKLDIELLRANETISALLEEDEFEEGVEEITKELKTIVNILSRVFFGNSVEVDDENLNGLADEFKASTKQLYDDSLEDARNDPTKIDDLVDVMVKIKNSADSSIPDVEKYKHNLITALLKSKLNPRYIGPVTLTFRKNGNIEISFTGQVEIQPELGTRGSMRGLGDVSRLGTSRTRNPSPTSRVIIKTALENLNDIRTRLLDLDNLFRRV